MGFGYVPMMHWKTKRRAGRWLRNIGYVVAWPGLWLMDKGYEVELIAISEKPLKPVIHDPNFVKSTRVE